MTTLIDQLSRLLEAERTALCSGNMKALGALAVEKEALTVALVAGEALDRKRLSSLHAQLLAHAKLVQAAQKGVVDVLDRLNAQRQARTQLRTYDKEGRDAQIGQTTPLTERRV